GRRPRLPRRDHGRGQSAPEAHPLAQEPVPDAAHAHADPGGAADARRRRRNPGAAARGAVGALRPALRSFDVPNYRRYFLGQLVSLSGTWMQVVAEMWLVLQLTHSGFAVGVAAALQFAPMLIGGAWGRLIAD